MRSRSLLFSGGLLLLAALAGRGRQETCRLDLELIDAATGRTLAGLVQVRYAEGELVKLAGLLGRGAVWRILAVIPVLVLSTMSRLREVVCT